jgi:TetR/AcrR family transcriptional regulator, lmrAB and yxaGH operons repressor
VPTPPKHRQAIVKAAVKLFRQRGYAGSGVADIADVAAAPKGSLYHYFPAGKASIGEAAVAEVGRRVVQTLEQLAKQSHCTADLIVAHAETLAGWMAKSRFRDGCPMTAVLLENAPQHQAIAAAGRKVYAARNAVLTARLMADGFELARAERLAVLCTSALQGALIQARVEKSRTPILIAARELATLLAATAVH